MIELASDSELCGGVNILNQFRQEVSNIFSEYKTLVNVTRDKEGKKYFWCYFMATEAQVMLIHMKDSLH